MTLPVHPSFIIDIDLSTMGQYRGCTLLLKVLKNVTASMSASRRGIMMNCPYVLAEKGETNHPTLTFTTTAEFPHLPGYREQR